MRSRSTVSINTVHNNQRDGHMRQQINSSKTAHDPNTMSGGCPFQAGKADGGFVSYNERIDASKVRARSQSFFDHFSQATLFFNSQSDAEKNHITDALRFELSKVQDPAIRERVVGLLTQVNEKLTADVADALGIKVPAKPIGQINMSVPADADPKTYQPKKVDRRLKASAALSMANTKKDSVETRCVAVLAANSFDDKALAKLTTSLTKQGAKYKIIAPKLGQIRGMAGTTVNVDESFLIATSVVFDAVYIAGGSDCVAALIAEPDALHFVEEAYKHCKPVAAEPEAESLLEYTYISNVMNDEGYNADEDGLILKKGNTDLSNAFINAMKQHRFWNREKPNKIPA